MLGIGSRKSTEQVLLYSASQLLGGWDLGPECKCRVGWDRGSDERSLTYGYFIKFHEAD